MRDYLEIYLPPLPEDAEGLYFLGADGSWVHFLWVDGTVDLPRGMLKSLRKMPREELVKAATGEGYLIQGERLLGNPLRCVLVVTKRGAEEIWPLH